MVLVVIIIVLQVVKVKLFMVQIVIQSNDVEKLVVTAVVVVIEETF